MTLRTQAAALCTQATTLCTQTAALYPDRSPVYPGFSPVYPGFSPVCPGFSPVCPSRLLPAARQVCSNRLLFEPTSGHLRAIEPSPPITGLNKHHTYARNRRWFDEQAAAGRRQLLLVGDSMGDLRCAEGVPDSFVVSSLGIFNENDGRRTLDEYEATFTSVISGTAASLEPLQRVIDGLP